MSIMVALLFYAVILTTASSIGAFTLGALTYVLTKHAKKHRKRAVWLSALFPFACVLFAGVWFGAYAAINYKVFHRDPGLGDRWQTPLPNGYALIMIDTTDQGTVYNPKTQPGNGLVMSREDAIFGVRQLQIENNRIFGARDRDYFHRIGQDSTFVDSYFEINTAENTHVDFNSIEGLKKRACNDGITLRLRRFSTVFDDFRWTWFDHLAVSLLLLAPIAAFCLLARYIWSIKQIQEL